jgi:methylmalonyl-CoA/ethylmalonyl-CoA epimerase
VETNVGKQRFVVEGDLTSIGARFDHTAVAAPRLRDLLPLYADLLGGRVVNGGDNQRVGYRALQLGYSDESRIELMEPLGGSTFFDSFFARGGGLHHVTFKVDDIHAAIDGAGRLGLTVVGVFLDDEEWKEAFLHPRAAHGVLVQFAQVAPGYPPPPGDLTIDQILAGHGERGNGIASP